MSYEFMGRCLNCGMLARFSEPNRRFYTCNCGDPGIMLDLGDAERTIEMGFLGNFELPPPTRVLRILANAYQAAIGKIRAAGSEAYFCPGSRPESPPGGRAPKGPSRGNSCQSLPTLDAFSAMIEGIEALRDRGKLNEERLRTIVSELITLIYRDQANGR